MADTGKNMIRTVSKQSSSIAPHQQQSSMTQIQSKQRQSSAVTTVTCSTTGVEQKSKMSQQRQAVMHTEEFKTSQEERKSDMIQSHMQISQKSMTSTTTQQQQTLQQINSKQLAETRKVNETEIRQRESDEVHNDDDDQNNDGDQKVIGSTEASAGLVGSDLYFTSLIEQEQQLTTASYSIRTENNNTANIRALTVHPDLISDLSPAALTTSPSSSMLINCTGNAEISHNVFVEDSVRNSLSSNFSKRQFVGKDLRKPEESGESEVAIEDVGDRENSPKKKKKAKKSESFSVSDVCEINLRNLAEKYDVGTVADDGGASELRACEKRVFKNVSVANLRRGFCDVVTTNYRRNDELTIHLVKTPKSGYSKFENIKQTENNADRIQKEGDTTPKDRNGKPGTHTCKRCGGDVFVMEMVKAEKASWHKNCFRCTECKKSLSVDTYESNAGLLYCKPHFRELFQPKVVLESPEEKLLQKIKRRPEVIIRENQPVELPPDVVRASVQPSTAELEELSVDVKSKFEMFEHYKEQESCEKYKREPVLVNKSNIVLAKMSRFEQGSEGQVGIPDSEINGEIPAEVSDDDDDAVVCRVSQPHLDEINFDLNGVKSKWESGMNSKSEEVQKHRQEQQARFRTRLCLGKNNQLKEMYEKATECDDGSAETVKRNLEFEQLNLKEKRSIKDMFEKGIVSTKRDSDDEGEEQGEPKSAIDLEVFENGVAKTSRNIFENIDKQLISGGGQPSLLREPPKKIALRSPSGIIGVNDQRLQGDIVKSSDVVQEEVRAEDVGNKFRFFESYQEQQEKSKTKKVFRITPPREGQVKVESPEREIYHDPNVVRATDTEPIQIPASKTASKMLSLFKKLEEGSKNDEVSDRPQVRPLKQFTPPRETRVAKQYSSEEEEDGSEYESEEENEPPNSSNNQEDQFLKEVGSLARAKSLRAKFEKWETQENARNLEEREVTLVDETPQHEQQQHSIESAKALRAIFEQPQLLEHKPKKKEVQVKRFVELRNENTIMEECVMCNKRVYAMEKAEVSGKVYHKTCFRCSHCKCLLRLDTFTQNQGVLFCKPHYTQLFRIKGNYDEGFGRETGKQLWAKKQQAKQSEETSEN